MGREVSHAAGGEVGGDRFGALGGRLRAVEPDDRQLGEDEGVEEDAQQLEE